VEKKGGRRRRRRKAHPYNLEVIISKIGGLNFLKPKHFFVEFG
jgi:hypothetical protein